MKQVDSKGIVQVIVLVLIIFTLLVVGGVLLLQSQLSKQGTSTKFRLGAGFSTAYTEADGEKLVKLGKECKAQVSIGESWPPSGLVIASGIESCECVRKKLSTIESVKQPVGTCELVPTPAPSQNPGDVVCIQVVTPAKDPKTGACKEFATPCDVPAGWEKVNSCQIPISTLYREDGTCPPGYVDYGMPLQCVTPKYMEYCQTNDCPECLAGNTLIDTPSGLVPVKDLQVGMPIWTTDKSGQHVSGVVQKTSRVPVPPTHQMVHLILNDGRELFVSPGHPIIDGRSVGDLTQSDLYDGASVLSAQRVPYGESATYDILPSGGTGFYWANGIFIGSTLR